MDIAWRRDGGAIAFVHCDESYSVRCSVRVTDTRVENSPDALWWATGSALPANIELAPEGREQRLVTWLGNQLAVWETNRQGTISEVVSYDPLTGERGDVLLDVGLEFKRRGSNPDGDSLRAIKGDATGKRLVILTDDGSASGNVYDWTAGTTGMRWVIGGATAVAWRYPTATK